MNTQLPFYHCRRIAAPLTLDGDLTKAAWRETTALDLVDARGGTPPFQRTTVRGCWDGAMLYLAFACQDAEIHATMTARDSLVWQEEAVEAFIGPYGDLVHYYEFQASPLNTLNDVRVTNPNARGENPTFDRGWTCRGWQSAVRVFGKVNEPGHLSQGWHVEWAIPLASLLEAQAGPVWPGEEWRINLFRIDHWPRDEHSAWSPTPEEPLSFHRPQYFGHWIFD